MSYMAATISGAMAPAATPRLSASEIAQARLYLEQARDAIIGAIKGVSEAQATFKPVPGVWSIAEIVEHVVFVQNRVLGPLREELEASSAGWNGRDYRAVDAIVLNEFPKRLVKYPAPEFAHPKGDLPLSEGMRQVLTNTRRTAEYLHSAPDLRQHVIESRPIQAISNGEHALMDGYQWILAQAAHTERHAKQILELKAHPNFPAS
jgi:DinB superfamily